MASHPSLILLPGLLCDEALWSHAQASLSDMADIRVADLTKDSSVKDMAKRVLDAAPARFALAGLSMGGYVAQEIMRQAPERVTRLALLDTSCKADAPEQRERRKALIQLSETGDFKGVTPRLLPMLIHPDRLADAALTQTVMAMAERVGQAAFARQQMAIMGRPEGTADLAYIRCPALVACGRQDALTSPELHALMAREIPGARLVIIEECGHLAPLEQPQAASALLRYWLQDG